MYYNLDVKTEYEIVRKVSKINGEIKLAYYTNLYLTEENQIIITKYKQ